MVEHAMKTHNIPNHHLDSKTPKLSKVFSENMKELKMQHKIIEGLQIFAATMSIMISLSIVAFAVTLFVTKYIM